MDDKKPALFVLGPLDGQLKMLPDWAVRHKAAVWPSGPQRIGLRPDFDEINNLTIVEYAPHKWTGEGRAGRERAEIWAPLGTSTSEVMVALMNGYRPVSSRKKP